MLFDGKVGYAACHSGPKFTDANTRLHEVSEVPSEPEPAGVPSYASLTATNKYRTSPLRVWQHPPYFHNGSAATLENVVMKVTNIPMYVKLGQGHSSANR